MFSIGSTVFLYLDRLSNKAVLGELLTNLTTIPVTSRSQREVAIAYSDYPLVMTNIAMV